MPGWRSAGWARKDPVFGIAICAAILALASPGHAAVVSPASRLAEAMPELFPLASLADATGGGEAGARVLGVSPGAAALGVQSDDVVLRVEGQPLGGVDWNTSRVQPPEGATQPTLTVWRAVPGSRVVQEPAAIGREALEQFIVLPGTERSPMRLAVMLANQGTVVQSGAGVALVPADATFDAARWLRSANPLPPESEKMVQQIASALRKRTRMPPASGEEIVQADRDLQHGKALEARERAQRVLVAAAREPAGRSAPGNIMDEGIRVYTQADLELRRRAALRNVPEPLLALVAEGNASYIDAFLPQKTLMHVDNSWGWGAQGGLRLRVAPSSVPFLSSVFLLTEIGYCHNNFDDLSGNPFLHAGLTQYTFELMYRPRVAAQLRPYLRGGLGIYSFSGEVQCGTLGWHQVIDHTDTGAVFGGGFDVLRVPSAHLRVSLGGTYRVLTSKFDVWEAPELAPGCGQNVPDNVGLEKGYYEFDLGGIQVGIMLTYVP
jgi:hypothetical protein